MASAPAAGRGGVFGRGLRRGGARRPSFESLEERVVCSSSGLAADGLSARAVEARVGPLAHHAPGGVHAAAPTRLANVVYTDPGNAPQVLDVYRPAGTPPPGGWPVVLAIHGGGWRKFNKEEYAAQVAPALLANGFAVVTPDYTLSTPQAPSWPAPFVQLQQAVRWVHANAIGLGLDPTRVAAMGESAGGHLALMLGTDPADPSTRVQAVVDFFGPADLASLQAQSPGARLAIDQMLGLEANNPAVLADASPLHHVSPDDPPTLILQGTADTLVPPVQSETLASALTAAGVPNNLILVPGAGHGFGFNPGHGRSLLPAVLSFLDRTLGTTG
jgi:acetyl esterase/lipase